MTTFTSTAREDVNRSVGWPPNFAAPVSVTDTVRPEDPEPWVSSNGFRHEVQAWHPISGSDFYDPRPGYRAPQNPILVAFREKVAERGEHPYWGDTYDSFMDWLDYEHDFGPTEGSVCHGYLPAHIEHARKVLTRLAAVFG